MKTCSKCNETKSFNEFYKNIRYKDGYATWCKTCFTSYKKKWEQENQTHRKEYLRQWHVDNIERRHEASNFLHSLKYKFDPEYKKRKNEQRKESHTRVDAIPREGSYTQAEWEKLKRKHNYKCVCCKQANKLEPDHVIPRSKGGSDYISNIQPLCHSCNSKKGTKETDYR